MDSINESLLSEGIVYCTALYLAAQNGHRDVVKYISEMNLVPPSEEMLRCTALYFAAQNGQLDAVRAISTSLIRGKLNHQNKDTRNISERKQINILKAGINLQDMKGNSALHYAAMEGNIDLIKKLILKGANIDSKNADYESALHLAVQNEQIIVVRYLLMNDADIDCKDKFGNTSIHYAIKNNYLDIVKLLLENDANVSISNIDKKLPLDYLKSLDLINVILTCNKNVNVKDSFGNNLLHIAAKKNFLSVVSLCIKKGIDVNSINLFGNTALHVAAEEGHIKILKELLKHNPSLYMKNVDGHLPIHLSLKVGHYNIAKLIFDSGIAKDVKYLHLAVENNHTKIVKMLLDTFVFNDNDIIAAFDIALQRRCDGIMDVLLSSVKDVNVINSKNIFVMICEAGHKNLVKILLLKGADTITPNYTISPLTYAIKGGFVNVVELLLKHQKDTKISYGQSYFNYFSSLTKDENIIILLQEYL